MTDEQCYSILGVEFGASEQEVKDAYKFLAHSLHPDKFLSSEHKTRAEEKLKELNAARDQILKSMKNSHSEQTNRRASYQPPRNRQKSRIACLTIIIGMLALLIIAVGASIYIGKNLLSPNDESLSAEVKSANATKVTEFTFGPEQTVSFPSPNDISPYFEVQPLELSAYDDKRIFLKVSICNTGTATGTLRYLNFWYTTVDAQNTVYWDGVRKALSLKPNSCEVLESWSKEMPSLTLTKPLGKLSIGALEKDLLGSIDLGTRSADELKKDPIILRK